MNDPILDAMFDLLARADDTHFSERGRHGRLLSAIARHPQILGVDIDERTAMVVNGKEFRVIGEGSVTIVDGTTMTHTDLVYKCGREPIGLFDVKAHVLPSGYRYNLEKRLPKAPTFGKRAGA